VRKTEEHQKAMKALAGEPGLNPRQVRLIHHALVKPGSYYTIETHMNTHGVTYETSRKDLMDLDEKGLLIKVMKGKSFLYLPEEKLRQRLKKNKR